MAEWDIGVAQSGAGMEASVARWDGANLTEVDDINVGILCMCCDWNSKGTLLAVGMAGGATPVRVFSWDGVNLALVDSLAIPGGPTVEGVTWSRDGKYLGLSLSNIAPFFRLAEWDGTNLSLVSSYVLEGPAWDCSFYPQPDLPEGKFIAVANRNAINVAIPFKVLKWDGTNLSLASSIALNERGYRSCHFSRDGKYIAISREGNFDVTKIGLQILSFDSLNLNLNALDLYNTPWPWPNEVRWDPNDEVVAGVRINAPFVFACAFDLETKSLTLAGTYATPGAANSCSWDHTGKFLVVGHGGGTNLRVLKWNGANLILADTMPVGFLTLVNGCSFYVPPLVLPKLGIPDNLLCEQKKNPADVIDPEPEFSAIHHYE